MVSLIRSVDTFVQWHWLVAAGPMARGSRDKRGSFEERVMVRRITAAASAVLVAITLMGGTTGASAGSKLPDAG
jgi:hypothetical protein